MTVYQTEIHVQTQGQGTVEITHHMQLAIDASQISNGIATILCKHTSCSLVLMENADPSARRDLEEYLNRLVPENDPHFTHTHEGSDDMPSHIKMALTRSSETIPVNAATLALGTWQGLFLWEHRHAPHRRQLAITVIGE